MQLGNMLPIDLNVYIIMPVPGRLGRSISISTVDYFHVIYIKLNE